LLCKFIFSEQPDRFFLNQVTSSMISSINATPVV